MAEHGSPDSSPPSDNEGGGSLREQDRFLPIANVGRIMKRALPANGKISKDAKETVQECVSEFISFITGEASDKCQREKRKTINGDDLLWAMSTLGFEEYIEPLKLYLHKYRELEGEKVSMAKQGAGSGPGDQSAPSKDVGGAANGGAIDGHVNGAARQAHGHVVYGQPAYQMSYQIPGAGAGGSSGGFAGGHGRLITPASLGGSKYFMTFIDNLSRRIWVYPLKNKSEAFAKFKNFKAKVGNVSEKKIKILRSDYRGEYLSFEFIAFYKDQGITR